MSKISRLIFGRRTSWLRFLPWLRHPLREAFLRRHAAAVPIGEDVLCRILGSYKLYADPDDRGISPHLILDGVWEQRVTEVLVDLLEPGTVVADVGANLGYFTILMAAQVGPRGRVLAFEPNTATARRLEMSLSANGMADRVAVHRAPLAALDGQSVTLIIPPHEPGGTQVSGVAPGGMDHFTATTRRLDGIDGALDAVLVKIDVEGQELAVWDGMTRMIAGSVLRYVIVEFTRESYSDPGRLLDEALAAGFELMLIDGARGLVRTNRAGILAGPNLQMLMLSRRA